MEARFYRVHPENCGSETGTFQGGFAQQIANWRSSTVRAVYARPYFVDSRKSGRSQSAPTEDKNDFLCKAFQEGAVSAQAFQVSWPGL